MKLRVEYTTKASDDIDGIAAEIAKHHPAASRRFLEAIESLVELIRSHPEIGGLYRQTERSSLRSLVVTGFRNYVVFYEVLPDRVLLVRVLHGARDLPAVLAD